MLKTDRTPWKMHLSPSDLDDRSFRVLCKWVILGIGEGGSQTKVAWNVLKHALVLEFLKSNKCFCFGGSQKRSCSECAETCSRFGIFEIQQIFLFGGSKKKLLRMC